MRDIEVTWSHIVGKKMGVLRAERGMTQKELAEKTGVPQSFISRVLGRQEKGSEDFFFKIGTALGVPKKQVKDILNSSLYEAIENEYPEAGLGFALKSKFGLSDQGLMDVLHFINTIQKKESKK